MLVLGLQGSPRKKGNTEFLLSSFMKEAEKLGAKTKTIQVAMADITPCRGCGYCEKKGFCAITDYMSNTIYPLLRKAEVIVIATPIFFYNTPSQLKALIDRSQALWSRKYKLNLTDPGRTTRAGYLLAQGATKGKNLFNGLDLTAKYFFDAVGASFNGSLTYRRIENPGDMKKHPTASGDIQNAAEKLLTPFLKRKKILFTCRENACRSQMASAFAKYIAGNKIEVLTGGSEPAEKINPVMAKAMEEKGIDMAYLTPEPIDKSISYVPPDTIITMGCSDKYGSVPCNESCTWDIEDPAGKPLDFMVQVRDDIEKRVIKMANIE